MNKLSNQIHQRLIAQAQEARELKQNQLAENVLSAVGASSREEGEDFVFSYSELEEKISKSLWNAAIEVVSYHEAEKADIQKMAFVIEDLTKDVIEAVEKSLGTLNKIGKYEPKLPGEK